MAVGVELNAVSLLMAPLVFLIRIVKVHIARKGFAEAESSRAFGLVLRPVEFGLDDEMFGAPGIGEVDKVQVQCFKAVPASCGLSC